MQNRADGDPDQSDDVDSDARPVAKPGVEFAQDDKKYTSDAQRHAEPLDADEALAQKKPGDPGHQHRLETDDQARQTCLDTPLDRREDTA